MTEVVIADDLTGACEIAAVWAKENSRVLVDVHFSVAKAQPPVTGVYNLATRACSPNVAYDRTAGYLRKVHDSAGRLLYKKIDSALRGCVSTELRAILDSPESGIDVCVVAPALPEEDRATVCGRHYVGDRLADSSPLAWDPLNPPSTSDLPALLRSDCWSRVELLDLDTLSKGVQYASTWLADAFARGTRLVAADATSSVDLQTIASVVSSAPARVFPVGSAGLFRELMLLKDPRSRPVQFGCSVPRNDPELPWLFVSGSLSPAAREQCRALCAAGAAVHAAVEAGSTDLGDVLVVLNSGRHVLLETEDWSRPSVPASPGSVTDHAAALSCTLSRTVHRILEHAQVGGVVAIGGDTASAVLAVLDCGALDVYGELARLTPMAALAKGPYAGLPLVTRSGGFGSRDGLIDLLRRLEAAGLVRARRKDPDA